MEAWWPQEAGLQQIVYLLAEYQKPGTNQGQVLSQLEQCTKVPDFNNYLAHIFAEGQQLSIEVRQSAGLLLKNNLKDQYGATSEQFRKFIKTALLKALIVQSKPLRQTAGTSIAVVVGKDGFQNWPELLVALTAYLDSSDRSHLEGSLDALYKITEDATQQLEVKVGEERPSTVLVPRLLVLFKSEHQEVKCLAISVMNMLALKMPAALADSLDSYVTGLFALAHDPSSEVRKVVCTGLVQLLHLHPQRLQEHMHDIIEYMLASTQDGDEGVALESCEFWSAFCEAAVEPGVLRPFLGRLIPVLLRNMVYDEYDEEVADAEAAEEAASAGAPQQEERDQELRPFHAKAAGHGETDSESDGEEVNRWNLRKCSAAGLDVLSTVFGEELLPIVTPIVQQRLQESDWRARESAILALGAISEGCAQGLLPYLADMVGMLLPKLHDQRPLVRSITCWALSRYSHWIVLAAAQPIPLARQQLDSVLEGILGRVLDPNKHVQEAACSGLASLEEEAGTELGARLPDIAQALGKAASTYTRKNMRILYDALGTLADAVGRALGDPALLQLFMPPLLEKWETFADTDRELMPLLECLTSLATAVGPAFREFAGPCFQRCERIVSMQLQARIAPQTAVPNGIVELERDFIICSLDLISGLAEGIGAPIEALLAPSQLRELLLLCCQDDSPDVRQSAFALAGDLSKVVEAFIMPVAGSIFRLGIAQLEPPAIRQDSMSACNNACWSLGELAIKCQSADLTPFATLVAERLVPILSAPAGSMPRSIIENSAITLGRVAWVCPEPIAPHLEHFVGIWCAALRTIRDDVEKEHAFLGLTAMLRLNPQGAIRAFTPLCEAVTSWRQIYCEGLKNDIIQLMQLYKQTLQPVGQWERLMLALQPAVQEKLKTMCHL